MNKWLTITGMLLLVAGVQAESLDSAYRLGGARVKQAFAETQPYLQTGSAVFKLGSRVAILGTVVSPDGHILTKASELGAPGDLEKMVVTVDQETYEHPKLLAEDHAWDVALVKVEAEGLTPVNLADREPPARGEWLVANGPVTRKERKIQVGVVAAAEREVKSSGGPVLGVALKAEEGKLVVGEVSENGGAARAGLQENDEILALDGEPVGGREELVKRLGDKRVGDRVTLRIKRGEEELDAEVELAGRADVFGEQKNRNDMMSGEFSPRRTGFPKIFQHDIMANRYYIGGPVLDLDGRCVGMNIARFSRCEFYAIPAPELRTLLASLLAAAPGE